MDGQSAKKANVFRVALEDDEVLVSLGCCQPALIDNGQVKNEYVEELGHLNVPIPLLPGLVRQMIAVAVRYERSNGGTTFKTSESDGVLTVNL